MKKINCIYCNAANFNPGKGSEEHAILSSLGGKKSSLNVCCQLCNNKLGDAIDHPFSEDLKIFSTMLNIKTGRKKPAPTHRGAFEKDGKLYNLQPGGNFTLSKPNVSFYETDNGVELSIIAASEEQATTLLKNALSRYGKNLDDYPSIEGTAISDYMPARNIQITLGGERRFRAAAKMILTYLATNISPERLRSGQFQTVIDYINNGGVSFPGAFIGSRLTLPKNPRFSDIDHRIFIFASLKKRLVVGVLELYGGITYTVELTNAWDGPDLCKVHVINPIDSRNADDTFDGNAAIEEYGDDYEPNFEQAKSGLAKIVAFFQNAQENDFIKNLVPSSIEKTLVGKGDIITQQMLGNLAQDIAEKYSNHIYRKKSSRKIKIK